MSVPTWDVISRRLSTLVADRDGEWSGLPIPIERHKLTIEPKNPWRDKVAELEHALYPANQAPDDEGVSFINQWYSRSQRCKVLIWRERNGRVCAGTCDHDVNVKETAAWGIFGASQVWNFEAECTAMEKLATLLKPHMFKMYVMTGALIETSARSGVSYIFRRCRPTLALRLATSGSYMRILCALCLHPIGYYEGTWAGSMVPTDEVIAHLLLMRGDEPLYWRRANQHPVWSPLAGI